MTRAARRTGPAGYLLRVDGHLDEHWSSWFGPLAVRKEDDGTTSLSGTVADQAELHRLLRKIRDLGVPLLFLEVADVEVAPPAAGAAPGTPSVDPAGGEVLAPALHALGADADRPGRC